MFVGLSMLMLTVDICVCAFCGDKEGCCGTKGSGTAVRSLLIRGAVAEWCGTKTGVAGAIIAGVKGGIISSGWSCMGSISSSSMARSSGAASPRSASSASNFVAASFKALMSSLEGT